MTHQNPYQDQPDDSNLQKITLILNSMDENVNQTDALIRLLYNELRQIAANRLASEQPGQTLQATALVHETYLRLANPDITWKNRRHFFAAAAEAMRRILIENARRRHSKKRGSNPQRVDKEIDVILMPDQKVDLLDLDEAIIDLEKLYPEAAELVKLRYFAGLTMQQVANAMGISIRTAFDKWAFAKAWLYRRLK